MDKDIIYLSTNFVNTVHWINIGVDKNDIK